MTLFVGSFVWVSFEQLDALGAVATCPSSERGWHLMRPFWLALRDPDLEVWVPCSTAYRPDVPERMAVHPSDTWGPFPQRPNYYNPRSLVIAESGTVKDTGAHYAQRSRLRSPPAIVLRAAAALAQLTREMGPIVACEIFAHSRALVVAMEAAS